MDKEKTLHYVADEGDFDEGERLIIDINGTEVAVFNIDSTYYALMNYCVHQGGPVCEGSVSGTLGTDKEGKLRYEREDEILSCPWHGWEFDIKTGQHLARSCYRLPTYDVVLKDSSIYVVR